MDIYGSKDASREAFQYGLLNDGKVWMDMIVSRNNTSHTYNESTASEIVKAILNDYFTAYQDLKTKLIIQKNKDLS